MRQVNVSLPDDLRTKLDAAANAAGHTLGTEIRLCIQRAHSWEQFDPQTQRLMLLIGQIAVGTERQTGRTWWHHPAAYFVFRRTIEILLDRNKPPGEPRINPNELPPNRPVAVTDLEQAAAGLEALITHGHPLQDRFETPRPPPSPTTPTPTGPYNRGATSPLGGQAKPTRRN